MEVTNKENMFVMLPILVIQKILIIEVVTRATLTVLRVTQEERDGWFWFDVATTCASFFPGYGALRALRVLRLVGRWAYFREHVEEMLSKSAKAVPLLLLAGLITYVHGVILYKEFHTQIPEMETFGGSVLTASFLILFDGPRALYGQMFSYNPIIAAISMALMLLVALIVISQILKVVIDSDDEKDALQAENEKLRVQVEKQNQTHS